MNITDNDLYEDADAEDIAAEEALKARLNALLFGPRKPLSPEDSDEWRQMVERNRVETMANYREELAYHQQQVALYRGLIEEAEADPSVMDD